MKMFQTKRFILDSLRNRLKRGVRMTIKEASERYNIPMEILREYESWGAVRPTPPLRSILSGIRI